MAPLVSEHWATPVLNYSALLLSPREKNSTADKHFMILNSQSCQTNGPNISLELLHKILGVKLAISNWYEKTAPPKIREKCDKACLRVRLSGGQ